MLLKFDYAIEVVFLINIFKINYNCYFDYTIGDTLKGYIYRNCNFIKIQYYFKKLYYIFFNLFIYLAIAITVLAIIYHSYKKSLDKGMHNLLF